MSESKIWSRRKTSGAANSGWTDISYICSMWILSSVLQTKICQKRSLNIPICTSSSDRRKLVSSFNHILSLFPPPFRSFTESSTYDLMCRSKKLTRQSLFLTSNYFHCPMLIYVDEYDQLPADVRGTLETAHAAVIVFSLLHGLFEEEAKIWYHIQHRAFIETVRLSFP